MSTFTNPPTIYAGTCSTAERFYAAHEECGEYGDGHCVFPTAAERGLELSYFGTWICEPSIM